MGTDKKTITLFDKEHQIVQEYDQAVCVSPTNGNNLDDYRTEDLTFGQKIYNVQVLDTGSFLYTTSPESKSFFVHPFPQMFGFPQQKQINQIINLEAKVEEMEEEIDTIMDSIERLGHRAFPERWGISN